MNNIEELLPIGSVVLLKNAKKKLMIIGVKQLDTGTKKTYDYLAVPFPEGYIMKECTFFVEHESIDKVFFKGYECEERDKFVEKMKEYYKNKESQENKE